MGTGANEGRRNWVRWGVSECGVAVDGVDRGYFSSCAHLKQQLRGFFRGGLDFQLINKIDSIDNTEKMITIDKSIFPSQKI
jgi:hypothetical protein